MNYHNEVFVRYFLKTYLPSKSGNSKDIYRVLLIIKGETLLTAIRFLVISNTPILIAKYLFTGSMKL